MRNRNRDVSPSTPPGLPAFESSVLLAATPWRRAVGVVLGTAVAIIPGLLVTDQPTQFLTVSIVSAAILGVLLQLSMRRWWDLAGEYVTILGIAGASWYSGRAQSPLHLLFVVPPVYAAMVYGPRRIAATMVMAISARLLLEFGSPLTRFDVAWLVIEIGVGTLLCLAIYLLRLFLRRTRDDLLEVMSLHGTVLAGQTQPFAIVDPTGVFIELSGAAATLIGAPAEQLVGGSWFEVIPRRWRDEAATLLAAAVAGEVQTFDIELSRTPDGPMQVRVVLVGTGLPSGARGALVLAEDVTAVRSAQTARDAARRRFERFAETAPIGIYLLRLHPEPQFEYINPALERITGVRIDEALEDPRFGLGRLDRENRTRLQAARADLDNWTEPVRIQQPGPDGRLRWHDIREFPYEDQSGQVVGVQGIVDDVTDEMRAQEQLSRALEREHEAVVDLTNMNEMKDVFLQSVSHELRTPLAGIVGFAETLVLRDLYMDETQRDLLMDRLLANAHRLSRLLNDLLDVDRLGRGVLSIDTEPVDLSQIVRDAVAEVDTDAQVQLSLEPVTIDADGSKLERIVENLVSNALNHGGRDVRVWVQLTGDETVARLVVEDNGPGIPAELRESITQPFVQGPSSASAAKPGTGIGLTLVTRFVDLHNGSVAIGERDGGGASITVTLPR